MAGVTDVVDPEAVLSARHAFRPVADLILSDHTRTTIEDMRKALAAAHDSGLGIPTAQRIMLEAADWPDRMARHAKELNDTYAAFSGAVEMLLTDLPDFTDACQDGAKCIAEHASTSSVMDLLNAKIFKAEIARLSVTELEERWAAGDLPEPYEVGSEVFPDDLELLQTEESIYLHDDEWYRLSPARQNTRR